MCVCVFIFQLEITLMTTVTLPVTPSHAWPHGFQTYSELHPPLILHSHPHVHHVRYWRKSYIYKTSQIHHIYALSVIRHKPQSLVLHRLHRVRLIVSMDNPESIEAQWDKFGMLVVNSAIDVLQRVKEMNTHRFLCRRFAKQVSKETECRCRLLHLRFHVFFLLDIKRF
jgi:hypothetical protein